MPPTMSKLQQKHYAPRPSGAEAKPRIGTNNNIPEVCINEDDLKDFYPGEYDIVRFWPMQSCGTNLLRLACKNRFTLPSGVKCYPVDFKGTAYCDDPKEDLKSEFRWVPCGSSGEGADLQVHLYMHDPANLNKDTFPYVLGTTQYKGKVIPCAVPEQCKDNQSFSTIFEIKHISWGGSWMFTINDVQPLNDDGKREIGLDSYYYIGRSPNGDAIRIEAHRQPVLLNPLTLMFMTDDGLRRPVTLRH